MCCLNTIKGKNVILCVSIRLPSIETLPIFSVTAEIFPTSTLFIMQQNLISSNRRKGYAMFVKKKSHRCVKNHPLFKMHIFTFFYLDFILWVFEFLFNNP